MSILLEPTRVANMELSNRFVRSATYDGLSTEEGEVTDGSVAVVRELAKGGVGLIITGFAYVTPKGQTLPRQTAACDDRFIPGLGRLAKGVHDHGGRVVLQIGDCGSQSVVARERGYRPLAPSNLTKEWVSFEGEREVTPSGWPRACRGGWPLRPLTSSPRGV